MTVVVFAPIRGLRPAPGRAPPFFFKGALFSLSAIKIIQQKYSERCLRQTISRYRIGYFKNQRCKRLRYLWKRSKICEKDHKLGFQKADQKWGNF